MPTASSGRDAWDEQKGKPSSRTAWRPDGSAVMVSIGHCSMCLTVCFQDILDAPRAPQRRPKKTPSRGTPRVPRARRVCAVLGLLGLLAGQWAKRPRLGPRVGQACAAPRGLGVVWAGRSCPRSGFESSTHPRHTDSSAVDTTARVQPQSACAKCRAAWPTRPRLMGITAIIPHRRRCC